MGSELPEGYKLDEPTQSLQTSSELPEGYTVDPIPVDAVVVEEKPTDLSTRFDMTGMFKKYKDGELQGEQLAAAHELNRRGAFKLPEFGEQMKAASMTAPIEKEIPLGVSHEQEDLGPRFDDPIVKFGLSALEAVANSPESVARVFKETISALSPIPKSVLKEDAETGGAKYETEVPLVETVKAGASVAMGAAQQLIPGEQEEEKTFDAAIDEVINKYGTKADLMQTIKSDPASFAADLSAVLTGGGGLVKGAAKVSGIQKLAKAGTATAKIGAAVEPFNIVKKLVSEPVRVLQKGIPGLKDMPMEWYKSAAKFPTAKHITEAHRNKWTKTALYNEIMPTHEGLLKLGNKINDINTEISGLIDEATKTGKTMPLDDIFKGLDELKLKSGTKGGTQPVAMQRQIENVRKQMTEANTMLKKGEIGPAYKTKFTPGEAQNIKKGIYKELGAFYTKSKNEAGRVVAGKKIAKNTKEFLQEAIPEIKELNRKDGDLIELFDNLTRPSTRIGNLNEIPLDLAVKMGGGAAAGGPIGTAMGAIAGIFDMPKVKAKLAIVLNKLERQGVRLSPTSTAFRDLIYESGKASKIEEKEE